MNSEAPRSTEIPMPTSPPPFVVDESEANTSGAPPPKANRVTPARLSDSLNVLDICYSDGLKNSSAVKLRI